jgi:AraC family transcriptional activator of pobA
MKNIPIRYIHPNPKEPNFSESFNIRAVRDLLAGKDMIQELHRHDFFYILILKKGTGTHTIDFTSYKICDHSIFVLRPGQVHQLELKAGSTGYLMQFKTGFYSFQHKSSQQLMRKASNKNFYRLEARGFKKILLVLNSVFQEYTEKQEGCLEVIQANLDIFFVELVRHNKNNKSAIDEVSLYIHERLEEFLELLEKDVSKHKQVSHYTDKMNLSSYQLNAVTKTALGKTCSDIINEYIILEARRYLLASSNQVSQIAYYLGYEDTSYFIRFFKKHTGYSPDAFRNNFK